MTYRPEPKVFELELFEGAYPFLATQEGGNNQLNTKGYNWTLDPSITDSSASAHVRRRDTIGMIATGSRWGAPAGVYKMSVEFSQKWDVTKTSAASTLKSTPLSSFYSGGVVYTVERDRFEVEAYDTGRNVSTGYNVFYYRAVFYVDVTTAGTYGFVPSFGNTYLSQNGHYDATQWSQYMRRCKFEKIEDVTI